MVAVFRLGCGSFGLAVHFRYNGSVFLDFAAKSPHNPSMLISLLESLGRRENIPLLVAGAVALTALLVWMAPAEATLGVAVKLVYVHAALMWVGFGTLTIAGITGLLFLLIKVNGLLNWSRACAIAGAGLLAFTGMLGVLTAKITWGGVYWGEPRLAMLIKILLIGVAAIALGSIKQPAVGALANIAFAGAAWILLITTERIIHPVSPIFNSDSRAIRLFPLLITALIGFAIVQAVRYSVPASGKTD